MSVREILFRGFHPCGYGSHIAIVDGKQIKGTWSYGSLVKANTGEYVIMSMLLSPKHATSGDIIVSETFGQFTGLRDSKRTVEFPEGQRIFEGDIVASGSHLLEIGIDEYGTYTTTRLSKNTTFTDFLINDYENGSLEVVGNIHENPELLEHVR